MDSAPSVTHRRPARNILAVLVLAGLAAGAVALGLVRQQTAQPLTQGPFRFQAWLLPAGYLHLQPLQYAGEAGAALAAYAVPKDNPSLTELPNTLLRLTPNDQGILAIAEQATLPAAEQIDAWTSDGGLLRLRPGSMDNNFYSGADDRVTARIGPLSSAAGGPSGTFDMGWPGGGLWRFVLLDAQRLAVLEGLPPPGGWSNHTLEDMRLKGFDGSVRLRIGTLDSAARAVQRVPDVYSLGPAWQSGNSLALVTRSGQLYVLDRETQRLVEQPECSGLAAGVVARVPEPDYICYSGGCLAVLDTERVLLRLFTVNGETSEIRLINPTYQQFEGSALGRSKLAPGSGRSIDEVLRAEGRRAPLTCTGTAIDAPLLPVGPGQFALYDNVYCRITLIEYKPELASPQPKP